jgi:hypothetical protein
MLFWKKNQAAGVVATAQDGVERGPMQRRKWWGNRLSWEVKAGLSTSRFWDIAAQFCISRALHRPLHITQYLGIFLNHYCH